MLKPLRHCIRRGVGSTTSSSSSFSVLFVASSLLGKLEKLWLLWMKASYQCKIRGSSHLQLARHFIVAFCLLRGILLFRFSGRLSYSSFTETLLKEAIQSGITYLGSEDTPLPLHPITPTYGKSSFELSGYYTQNSLMEHCHLWKLSQGFKLRNTKCIFS